MTRAISLWDDNTARRMYQLTARTKDANHSRRLLPIAAIYDGMNRTQAARISGMDWQTLRRWVHRSNAEGADGRRDHWHEGPQSKSSGEQRIEPAAIVGAGSNLTKHGVVRWQRSDLKAVIAARFGVT